MIVSIENIIGTCYTVVKDKLNWKDAQKRCNSLGGDLAAIKSSQTQSFISSKNKIIFADNKFWQKKTIWVFHQN